MISEDFACAYAFDVPEKGVGGWLRDTISEDFACAYAYDVPE